MFDRVSNTPLKLAVKDFQGSNYCHFHFFLLGGSVLGYMGYLSQSKDEQFENQCSEKINQNDGEIFKFVY